MVQDRKVCPYAVCASTSAPRIQRPFMNKFFQKQRMKKEHKTYTHSCISEYLIMPLFITRTDALRYEKIKNNFGSRLESNRSNKRQRKATKSARNKHLQFT